MFEAIRNLFGSSGDADDDGPDDLHLAAAVLMVEAAAMDGEIAGQERETIKAILMRHFDLSDGDAARLLSLAEAEQESAHNLHRYTSTVKNELSENQRLELIELLWEVVYADCQLHDYEANLLRRIGGLLYVSDRDRGAARKRVIERLGVQE